MLRSRLTIFYILFFVVLFFPKTTLSISVQVDTPITPNDEFFVESIDNFDIKEDEYRLTVTGSVFNPLILTLNDIKNLPSFSEIVSHTCIAYKYGATHMTGVANFTGVKLSTILNLAEINFDDANDISFHTPDPDGYSTSLNITEAYSPDVILAYEMNEEDLPRFQGYPLRLVVPQMYGYKWIKWVSEINIVDYDYIGYWENLGYEDSPYIDIVGFQIYYGTSILDTTTNPTSLNSVNTTDLSSITMFWAISSFILYNKFFKHQFNKRLRKNKD